MKKLLTLVVAGAMVLGSLGAASAVDVKVNGQWWFWYNYASNRQLTKNREIGNHTDRVHAIQRTRVQIQFIADENLSALLNLEHNSQWGNISTGLGAEGNHGAINADRSTFGVKRAHLDWTVPGTQFKTRMGIQGIAMPGVAAQNPVLTADVAGLTVSNQFTPNVGLTAFWARAYDSDTNVANGNTFDETDVFGVMLPIKTDVIRATPWGMVALIGKNSAFHGSGNNYTYDSYTATQVAAIAATSNKSQGYGWWLGTTLELPVLDPFFVNVDAILGGLRVGDVMLNGQEVDANSTGWYVAADMGYKFSFAKVSVTGFYSSGNKDVDDYGQLPVIGNDGAYNLKGDLFYGLGSSRPWRRYDGYMSSAGQGMWGLGFKVMGMSFVNNLTHDFGAMWYGGTNKGDSVDTLRSVGDMAWNRNLATSDHAWEVVLANTYKVNDNLSLRLDVAYIQLELGDSWVNKEDTKGSFITGVGVQYLF